ncbi:unnamed protein product [Amoebophrya sp. A25]|nr:unnamed protein product [Amoebophrya sp. A25]|eukprot:GSA25T00001324001.1
MHCLNLYNTYAASLEGTYDVGGAHQNSGSFEIARLRVQDLRFSQCDVSAEWKDFERLGTLAELIAKARNEHIETPEELFGWGRNMSSECEGHQGGTSTPDSSCDGTLIEVVAVGHKYYAVSNRRTKVVKDVFPGETTLPVKLYKTADAYGVWAFLAHYSTVNDGESVVVIPREERKRVGGQQNTRAPPGAFFTQRCIRLRSEAAKKELRTEADSLKKRYNLHSVNFVRDWKGGLVCSIAGLFLPDVHLAGGYIWERFGKQ